MSQDPIEDEKLWSDLQEGHAEAFRQLVESRKHHVLNICFRIVNNREDAEDLAQETFVEVFRSVGRFRKAAHLNTWIYRIAVSKCLNFLRDKRRHKRGGPPPEISKTERRIPPDEIAAAGDPHERLEQKERERILFDAINRLPENQRVALTLSKYDGISYTEIADLLGSNVAAVEALIHRAKVNLRKKLTDYFGNDDKI